MHELCPALEVPILEEGMFLQELLAFYLVLPYPDSFTSKTQRTTRLAYYHATLTSRDG